MMTEMTKLSRTVKELLKENDFWSPIYHEYLDVLMLARTQKDMIDKIRADRAGLKAWHDDVMGRFADVMAERCAHDERHCTCVPFLRWRIAELQEQLRQATKE